MQDRRAIVDGHALPSLAAATAAGAWGPVQRRSTAWRRHILPDLDGELGGLGGGAAGGGGGKRAGEGGVVEIDGGGGVEEGGERGWGGLAPVSGWDVLCGRGWV